LAKNKHLHAYNNLPSIVFAYKPTFAAVRFKFTLIIIFLFIFQKASTAQEPAFCIDSIAFSGDYRTAEQLLLRELNFAAGDCIALDSLDVHLNIAEQRLFNTQLFNKVVADTANYQNKNIVHFYLDERFPIFPEPNLEFADRNFNVWWEEQNHKLNRLNLGLGLLHKNFRGRREQLGINVQIGYTQKFAIKYEVPFVDKAKKHGFGISAAYLSNLELAYKTDSNKLKFKRFEDKVALQQWEFASWYRYRPRFATTHQITLGLKAMHIHDSIATFYNTNYLGSSRKKAWVLNAGYRIDYNGVDNWNYPLKGIRLIGIANIDYMAGAKLLPSLHWQADWYDDLGKNWYASVIVRGRKAFGKELPYIFQKNMGYDFDEMRGYEYYVHDGTFFNIVRVNLKYKILDHQFKLPIRYFRYIPIKLFLKTHGDWAYTYTEQKGNNYLSNKNLYAFGFGLDIVTLYDIRIRLEYTFNDNGDRALYLHKSGE
jgi:outer membrane protein assembly factor BamA